jgi:hypothetical protein
MLWSGYWLLAIGCWLLAVSKFVGQGNYGCQRVLQLKGQKPVAKSQQPETQGLANLKGAIGNLSPSLYLR